MKIEFTVRWYVDFSSTRLAALSNECANYRPTSESTAQYTPKP